jgi:dTDP-glucose 4,6-dehydratase
MESASKNIHKTILVTGGAGFIGSNFIRYALHKKPDLRLINLDALTYAGNPANLSDLESQFPKRYRFLHGNICDGSLLEKLFNEETIEGVIHFAAESHVDRSIHSPMTFVETNILGTCRLMEVCSRHLEKKTTRNQFRFLHISTDEVYGSLGESCYFVETSPYNPSSPYSASKAGSDHMVRAWCRTYGFPAIVINSSNNFGPYQFPEKLIPLMIINLLESKSLPVYGDGKNIRDWLYVIDHCEALLTVFFNGTIGETYNIGGGAERQNIEVVYTLCEILDERLGRKGKNASRNLIDFVKDRPAHDRRYAIDATKIKRELGWKPKFRFETALAETVDWYIGNREWINCARSGEYRNWIKKNYHKR